jgi:ferredoxin-type protein NapH
MKNIKGTRLRALLIVAVTAVILVGYIIPLDIGNLSALGIGVISAICPLGVLETGLAELTLAPRAIIALLLALAFTVVLGKVFCAWICPTSLLQRWFPGRKRKRKELNDEIETMSEVVQSGMQDGGADAEAARLEGDVGEVVPVITVADGVDKANDKHRNIKFDSRHVVLGGSLLSAAVFGFPVFCLICPVGLTFASLLVIYRLFGFGEITWAVIVFPMILVLELVVFRKWCSKICPLGALLSLGASLNRFFRPQIDESKCLVGKGVECSVCAKACSRERIDLRRPAASKGALGDCTKCRDCADACPAKAISFPLIASGKKAADEKEAV